MAPSEIDADSRSYKEEDESANLYDSVLSDGILSDVSKESNDDCSERE